MRLFACFAFACLPSTVLAQWNLVTSPTKANLESVHALENVVWISGENGTVLRSVDDGANFTVCAVPKGSDHAHFRSIQGIDADTAVVMSSGKGSLSRLYRTNDGCKTWKQVFANPDATGSFDSLRRVTSRQMYLLSEPVTGKFILYFSQDGGSEWFLTDDPGLDAIKGETAENSTLLAQGPYLYFGTGGGPTPIVHFTTSQCTGASTTNCSVSWSKSEVAIQAAPGMAVHALVVQMQSSQSGKVNVAFTAVGGATSDDAMPFAATSAGGTQWTAAAATTHGNRTAAMIDGATQTIVAVGPNGTDLSYDYGKHWVLPKSATTTGWRSLSLPFAVGANGQIGKLSPEALSH